MERAAFPLTQSMQMLIILVLFYLTSFFPAMLIFMKKFFKVPEHL